MVDYLRVHKLHKKLNEMGVISGWVGLVQLKVKVEPVGVE